jgi:hypothetical protein
MDHFEHGDDDTPHIEMIYGALNLQAFARIHKGHKIGLYDFDDWYDNDMNQYENEYPFPWEVQ